MRILFVATDADIGGAEVLLETLAVNRRPGDDVALVVLMGPGSLSVRLEAAMDSVQYLGFSGSSRNVFAMVRALERVIRAWGPDVISSHMFHADLVTALATAPNAAKITTVHTQRFGRGVHPLTRVIAGAVGLLSRRFDAVVATSHGAVEFARRYRYARPAELIANSVGMPPVTSFKRSSRVLLSLARFHPVKGHGVLLSAFARLADDQPEWTLLCAGPGIEASNRELMKVVAEAGAEDLLLSGRIALLGPVHGLSSVMSQASALVISSTYGESAPIVGVEALAHGIPVITTDLGVSAQYTEPPLVVAPGSVDELHQAMRRFCELSDDERQSLSTRARSRCENEFSVHRTIEELDTVYREAIAANQSSSRPARGWGAPSA